MSIKIHDAIVADVMTELCGDYFPGVRLIACEPGIEPEPNAECVLRRWEAEDLADRAEARAIEAFVDECSVQSLSAPMRFAVERDGHGTVFLDW